MKNILSQKFGNTGLTKYKVFIDEPIDRYIDDLFNEVNADFHLVTGDIAPEQLYEVESIKFKLKRVLSEYVKQNYND